MKLLSLVFAVALLSVPLFAADVTGTWVGVVKFAAEGSGRQWRRTTLHRAHQADGRYGDGNHGWDRRHS